MTVSWLEMHRVPSVPYVDICSELAGSTSQVPRLALRTAGLALVPRGNLPMRTNATNLRRCAHPASASARSPAQGRQVLTTILQWLFPSIESDIIFKRSQSYLTTSSKGSASVKSAGRFSQLSYNGSSHPLRVIFYLNAP